MCGIAGVAGRGAHEGVVRRMTDAERHRGPDGEGIWSADGICLGHRRLNIIDLTSAGRQPMSTPDGRFTIVYNGEVYNYLELRAELGGEWRSHSDTEVLLRAYEAWGEGCLSRLVGMFAFAIWDARKKELFCARDRLGIKPFYFATRGGDFLFASEIRALRAAGVPTKPDPSVLYDFLARDFYEHTDDTFFAGIRKLPPASSFKVRDGRPSELRRYWDLAEEASRANVPASPREREDKLLELCRGAVDLHLRSDVPVGVALSGGLDSATLLTMLDRTHPEPAKIEAFSFMGDDPAYSERPYVERMARETGRRAHFSVVGAHDFADAAPEACWSQEEPFAGAPIVAYAECFRRARREGFIVVMDGSGVDEALAGYDRFRPALWADLLVAGDEAAFKREAAAAGVTSERAHILAAEAAGPASDVGRGQDLTVSVRPDCLSSGFAASAARPLPLFERPFPDHLRNLMYRELRYTKLPRALRFRDRLSMAAGCELRPPFLDHRLLAYAFALPAQDRIHDGVTKAILRRGAERFLPGGLAQLPKRSVQMPQREWLRGPLSGWARDILDTKKFWERGWIDRDRGRAAMEEFFRGEGDNSFFLWQWINLELWARRFLDQPA